MSEQVSTRARLSVQATAIALPLAVLVYLLWTAGEQQIAVALFLLAGPLVGLGLKRLNQWLDRDERATDDRG